MSIDTVCMLDILGIQLYDLRVSLCATLDVERLHVVGAGFDCSVLVESDSWCR